MTLREYLKHLNKLVENDTKLLDAIVVSASDDEGNSFSEVFFKPSIGKFDDRLGDVVQICIN